MRRGFSKTFEEGHTFNFVVHNSGVRRSPRIATTGSAPTAAAVRVIACLQRAVQTWVAIGRNRPGTVLRSTQYNAAEPTLKEAFKRPFDEVCRVGSRVAMLGDRQVLMICDRQDVVGQGKFAINGVRLPNVECAVTGDDFAAMNGLIVAVHGFKDVPVRARRAS